MRYNPIYHTKQWNNIRKAVLIRDEYACQECKRIGKNTAANTVHHIKPKDMNLFYATDNMISLCATCHNNMHSKSTDELTDKGNYWLTRSERGLIRRVTI